MVSESLLEQLINNRGAYHQHGINADLLRALMVSIDDYYTLALNASEHDVIMAYYHALCGIRGVYVHLGVVFTAEQRQEFLTHLSKTQSLVDDLALAALLKN